VVFSFPSRDGGYEMQAPYLEHGEWSDAATTCLKIYVRAAVDFIE
jgi:hypothetical protein